MQVKGKQNKKKNQEEQGPNKKEIIRKLKDITDIYELLEFTKHEDNDIRLAATTQLCPCRVLDDIEEFWDRVFELVEDEDVRIRSRILHIICDGSPPRLENRIIDALDKFNRDSDSDIRRTAHKVLSKVNRGNSWNIL